MDCRLAGSQPFEAIYIDVGGVYISIHYLNTYPPDIRTSTCKTNSFYQDKLSRAIAKNVVLTTNGALL